MKAALALFHGIFNGLFSLPLFDTGVNFGNFIMAFVVFDVMLIVLRHVFRKESGNSFSGGQNNGGLKQ